MLYLEESVVTSFYKQLLQELRGAGFDAYFTADHKIQCITDSSTKLPKIRQIVGEYPTTSHYANGKIYIKVM
jgi:hypothetical protein